MFNLIWKQNLNVLSHHILASFDEVNLYTNIPISKTLMDVEQQK